MVRSSISPHRLALFLAAFLFSTGGAAIKACHLTSWQVASFRSAIAGAVLAICIPEARRQWNVRMIAPSIAYAATLVSFVAANKLTTSANAIFLQSTGPLYLLFLGPVVLKEKITVRDLGIFAAVAGGAALLLYGSAAAPGTGSSLKGNLIAMFSGLAWACTITGLRWMGRHGANPSAGTATAVLGNIFAFVGCLPLAVPVSHADPASVAVLLYLGIFQVGLAYVFLTRSIRHVPAFESATLLMVEPVFNPFWTWLFWRETPGLLAVLGGVLIILAGLASAFFAPPLRNNSGQNS